jgi:hypothetical protein
MVERSAVAAGPLFLALTPADPGHVARLFALDMADPPVS